MNHVSWSSEQYCSIVVLLTAHCVTVLYSGSLLHSPFSFPSLWLHVCSSCPLDPRCSYLSKSSHPSILSLSPPFSVITEFFLGGRGGSEVFYICNLGHTLPIYYISFCLSQQCSISIFWHIGLGLRHCIACVKVKQVRLRNFSWIIYKAFLL